jgi:hypothetical protein
MYTSKQTLMWTVLICVAAWGQEGVPQNKAPKLSFEISDQSLIHPSHEDMPRLYSLDESPQPFAYAAAISKNDSVGFRGITRNKTRGNIVGYISWLKDIAEKQNISDAQKAFLLKAKLAEKMTVASSRIIESPQPSKQLLLYAVSIEDAQKMAQAYYDAAFQSLEEYQKGSNDEIAWCEKEIARHQTQLEDVECILKTAEQAFEDLKRKVPYRGTEEAKAALAEFNRMLNALTVEISGIEATIKAIGDYRADKRTSPQLLVRLEDMLIEEAIKRTAAEARENTASALQASAIKYIDLEAKISRNTTQKKDLARSIPRLQKQQEEEKSRLKHMITPQILNNKVTIYPVH